MNAVEELVQRINQNKQIVSQYSNLYFLIGRLLRFNTEVCVCVGELIFFRIECD